MGADSRGKPMRVAELIAVLEEFPKDALVLCDRYSDMVFQEPPQMVEVVMNRSGDWYELYRPKPWDKEPKPRTLLVCHFEGN